MNYNITIEKIDTNKPSIDGYSMPGGKYHVQVSRKDKLLGDFAPLGVKLPTIDESGQVLTKTTLLGGAYCDYPEDIMENVIEFLENDLNEILEEENENE